MKKYLFVLVCCAFFHNTSRAQFSAADSAFLNSLFVENLYINPNLYSNTWFNDDSLGNINDLFLRIHQQYPFYDSMLIGAYSGIQFNGSLEYNQAINNRITAYNTQNNANLFGNENPMVTLPFQLNGIQGACSALLDTGLANNSGDAFVIISGTGDNQLTRIAVNPNDYHNLNCEVRYHLKQKGDVFIVGNANEDHRAIHFNKKKLGRYYPSMPTFLHNYLNNTQQSMGINHLIETIALIKYLKTKYQRVYVLGLSSGGTEALWVSLLTQPKATLVASGYSVLFDTDSTFQAINGYFYGNCMTYFLRDTVKKYINEGTTHYFFTQALGDLAIFQQDSTGNHTPGFFAGNHKCQFVSNYYHHAFPPCSLIDTFLNHVPLHVHNQTPEGPHVTYTNPVYQNLSLHLGDQGKKSIRIYDLSGRCLYEEKTQKTDIDIDLSAWGKGLYVFEVSTKGGVFQQKVIKL
ncbi:MAG: T9SS type A sorting domain-containing protein [Chitinophagaceae bacterium]